MSNLEGLRNKTFLITGAAGMLGKAFHEALIEDVGECKVMALSHQELDITDRNAVLSLEAEKPDFILHCAAQTNVDRCQEEPEDCACVQIDGTLYIAELAQRVEAKVFYPQSFLIFDGSETPTTEATAPAPLSIYGNYKLEAERQLLLMLPDCLVVRMAGFFGGEEADKNFVGKFARHLVKLIGDGVTSYEVGDRIWQPTYTLDLARNCLHLLALGKTGTYNMAGHTEASFFELAQACVEYLGLSDRITIERVSADIMAQRDRAARPKCVLLANQRLQAENLDLQRAWQVSLKDYLSRPYFHNLFQSLNPGAIDVA